MTERHAGYDATVVAAARQFSVLLHRLGLLYRLFRKEERAWDRSVCAVEAGKKRDLWRHRHTHTALRTSVILFEFTLLELLCNFVAELTVRTNRGLTNSPR